MTSRILHSCLKCSRLYCTFFRAGMWVGKFNNSYKVCKWTCSGPAVLSQELVRQAHLVWKSFCARLRLVLIVSKNGKKPKCWKQPNVLRHYDRGTQESVMWWHEGMRSPSLWTTWLSEKIGGAYNCISVCINISIYTQGINSHSCYRKENWVARRETFTLFYFLGVNLVNVQFQTYQKIKTKNSCVPK